MRLGCCNWTRSREQTMPMYWQLKRAAEARRHRTVDSILRLRRQLAREVPARTQKDTLLAATWNLRDFDSNKFGHGPRLTESFHYIAETINAFDIVALQEVNRSTAGLDRVLGLLGRHWSCLVTDLTEGPSGNGERMAFVFDSRKVSFRNVAGEVVLPDRQLIDGRQFARTPFLASFQAHWLKFNMCSVHMYYGDASGEGYERRVKEIRQVGRFLKKRFDRDDENFILLGDMNVVSPDDRTMAALKASKFSVLESGPTNAAGTKHYDQIAFLKRKGELELNRPDSDGSSGSYGVFNPFKSIFRPRDSETYHKLGMKNGKWPDTPEARKKYFRTWRTFQLSDHLPLWAELRIDFTERYLTGIRNR